MRKFILILSMVFWALTFVSCGGDKADGDQEARGESREEETQCKGGEKYTTLTVKANLESGYSIKVEGTKGVAYDVTLSTGQCVKIGCAKGVVVSVEQNNKFTQLCSNKDEDKDNHCKGSYDVIYKVADPQAGTNKLALEPLVVPNESKECVVLLPEDEVYTITVIADLGGQTVKVQDEKKSKILKEKGSCLKLKAEDFFNLQVDLGEGEENRYLLCSNKKGAIAKKCGGGEHSDDETNMEIALHGQPPNPDAVVLNVDTEYNNSESCEWLNE